MYSNLVLSSAERVLTITISREPVRNALNQATIAELLAALQAAEADDDVRAIIITGAGQKAFVAGADINELRALPGAEQARQLAARGHALGAQIAQLSKPVIAAINGVALGGGCELALACDIRIAAETARLGQPEINLGIIPGWGGTQRLTRLVGPGMSKLLNMTGEPIDAHEALRIGLVERVVPAEQLASAARALALTLAAKAPLALAAIKQAINGGANMPLQEANAFEAALFGAISATADAKEGTGAFLEKRQPTWRAQ